MKLLFLIYDHPHNPWVGGGGAVRVHETARRLGAMGHRVTVLSGNFPGADALTHDGYECLFTGSGTGYRKSTFSYAWRAAGFVRRRGGEFDAVIEDYAPWNPAFSCLMTSRPTVLHVNHREGINILKRHGLMGLPFWVLDLFYHRMFKNMTALSEGTRAKFRRPDAKVVPAGVDEALLGVPHIPASSRGEFILFIGRLEVYNKGLDTLMSAMRKLGGVKLVMTGKGRDEGRVREMARGLNVDFRGFVSEEEKRALLSEACLLVLPSRFEGWGIVLQEAAAMATPVVVSDIPELSFPVEHGFGRAFPVGDAEALASRIAEMYDSAEARSEMGSRGIDYVRSYTWQAITEDFASWMEGRI